MKVGEYVKCVRPEGQTGLVKGGVYKLYEVYGKGSVSVWLDDKRNAIYKQNRFVTTKEEKGMEDNKWSFTVTSGEAIDFNEIIKCLSYKEPLAFVDAGGSQYACIHDSIEDKAYRCKGKLKLGEGCNESMGYWCTNGIVVELDGECGRKEVLNYVKAVKGASWKKKFRKRQLVTVIQPKV